MPSRSVNQWNRLSDSQRKRYVSAGRTGKLSGTAGLTPAQVRKFYLSGGDLGGGRGYHPVKNAAPRIATDRSSIGVASSSDLKSLRSWRKNEAPKWLPKSQAVMGDDTAAILSQIGLQPKNWKSVTITPNGDGSFTMTVQSKRSNRVRKVLLPDRDSVVEVRNLFNASTRRELAPNARERARLEREWTNAAGVQWQTSFEIGYYTSRTNEDSSNAVPTRRQGQALPRRR